MRPLRARRYLSVVETTKGRPPWPPAKGGRLVGRRTVVLAATTGGVALADNIDGNGAGNRLVGTDGKDTISGAGGADDIFGKGGQDRLFGDSGNDDIYGGEQGDRLQAGTGQDDLFGQGATTSSTPSTGKPTTASTAVRATTT